MKLAEENLRQVSGKSTSFGVLKYSFGDSIDTLLKWQQRVRRTDKKQADTTARKFDLVICSDVVYDEDTGKYMKVPKRVQKKPKTSITRKNKLGVMGRPALEPI